MAKITRHGGATYDPNGPGAPDAPVPAAAIAQEEVEPCRDGTPCEPSLTNDDGSQKTKSSETRSSAPTTVKHFAPATTGSRTARSTGGARTGKRAAGKS